MKGWRSIALLCGMAVSACNADPAPSDRADAGAVPQTQHSVPIGPSRGMLALRVVDGPDVDAGAYCSNVPDGAWPEEAADLGPETTQAELNELKAIVDGENGRVECTTRQASSVETRASLYLSVGDASVFGVDAVLIAGEVTVWNLRAIWFAERYFSSDCDTVIDTFDGRPVLDGQFKASFVCRDFADAAGHNCTIAGTVFVTSCRE